MHKKIIFSIAILLLTGACSMIKAPEFKGITGIDLKKNAQGNRVLVANAKFYNPNLLGGQFQIKDVKVFINDRFLANLNANTYKVPSKKDFVVPLEVDFDMKFLKKDNLLNTLNAALNNKLKVQYKGEIYYVSHGLNVPYAVDYTQNIKLIK